jgi:hypothetical protein
MRNCTRDEGGPFGFGNQVLILSHRKLLRSKAVVVNVAERRNEIPAGTVERGERKLPVLRALSLCTCCRHYPGAADGRTRRSN